MFASSAPDRAACHLTQAPGRVDRPAGFWVGDRPFPHWLAEDLATQAREFLAESTGKRDCRRRLQAVIRRRLLRWGRPGGFAWERLLPAAPANGMDPVSLLPVLTGRILFANEIAMMCRKKGLPERVDETLGEMVAAGLIQARPAIEVLHFGRAVCRRCGETSLEQEDCWVCGDTGCWTCPTCRRLGPATGCRSLYARARTGVREGGTVPTPSFAFALTSAQQRAAASLSDFLSHGEGNDFLIWAVCGAGKTEVFLTGMTEELRRGSRVLVATPRRDVADELAGRIAAAFPGLSLSVHYGGRHEDDADDPAVTVATTHQCLRFYEAFDLVILDEVDAFPFHGSRMLYAAVSRARSRDGRLVYLTATPPPGLEERAIRGSLPYVRLPVRPHAHPLPVPEIIRAPLGMNGTIWRIPQALETLLLRGDARPALLFVPTVELADRVGRAMNSWGKCHGKRIAAIHAADPLRDEKRKAFAAGRLDLLVATTVLERGLTLGALDVYILFAEEERVFDAACLIQMAGRAGRIAADPRGRVFFLGERVNSAMRAARSAIEAANEEARRDGYLAEI